MKILTGPVPCPVLAAPASLAPRSHATIHQAEASCDASAREAADVTSQVSALPDLGRRTLVMGILNLTPDSFSGDGLLADADAALGAAVARADRLVAAGADLLDVGGESTRPGHAPVAAEIELARVVPLIERL